MIHMTVKVHLDTKSISEHSTADKVDLRDGHLIVERVGNTAGKKTVAIYAPGRWQSAEVSDTTEAGKA